MSKLGNELIESLTDALAHAKGERSGVRLQTVEVGTKGIPPNVDARTPAADAEQRAFAGKRNYALT